MWSCPSRILHSRSYSYAHVPKKKPPHILGPGRVWRKCFEVRPLTEISDPLPKHQWLTKSVLIRDLPQCITSQDTPSDSILRDFEERVCDFLAYQVRKPYKGRGEYATATVSGLLQSALTSVWSLAGDYRHIRHSHMSLNSKVESYWRREGHNFLSRTQPLYIMHTDMALGLFRESESRGDGTFPTVQYSPIHLSLFNKSVDQILPFGGCRKHSPYSLAHTSFIVDQKNHNPEYIHTHGLIQLFSQSVGDAVMNGFKLDHDIPYPLVTQGIITNGKKFTFVCFQLNTLDLQRDDSDSGKYNMFWTGPTHDLFDEVEAGVGLKGFNKDCARLIIQFLLHRPVRDRMRQWGGGISKAMPAYKIPTEGQRLSPVGTPHVGE